MPSLMGRTERLRLGSGPRRVTAVIGAVVLVVAVVSLAVSLANSSSARQVADNATLLHWTNATQGSAALSRSATGQAVLFGLSYQLGTADQSGLSVALAEAESARAEFRGWLESMPADVSNQTPSLAGRLDAFDTAGEAVLSAVAEGRFAEADNLYRGDFETTYTIMLGTVDAAQATVADLITNNEDTAGLIADVTTIVVTLLIPATAIVIYWLVARRQLRDKRTEMMARVDAQRELVAGVSHELRTPLSAIYGFSEVLLHDEVEDAETRKELIRVINTESADLTRMVDDLLTAARLDAGELTFMSSEFSAREAIEQVAEPFRKAGHEFVLDCDAEQVFTDPIRFRQIVRNLISNAFRHGGPIVRVVATSNHEAVRVTIMDNGRGVDLGNDGELFAPFSNAGEKALLSGSVGLGLAVSRAAARAMGGDLTYDHSNGWTSFVLTLPAGVEGAVAAERSWADASGLSPLAATQP